MAIQRNFSRIDFEKKVDVALDPAYTGALENGMIMVVSANAAADGGQLVVPCAGSGTERVAGVLWLGDRGQVDVPVFEDVVIPSSSPFTLTLREVPLSVPTGVRAYRTDTGAAVTVVAGTSPGAGEIAIGGTSGKLVTADSALAGLTLRITYRFAITADELARRGGRRSINIGPERSFNQVGLLQGNLELMLSNFVTSDPYGTATNFAIKTAAGGKFGTSGAGVTFARCTKPPVMELSPGIEQAFVTIQLSVLDL